MRQYHDIYNEQIESESETQKTPLPSVPQDQPRESRPFGRKRSTVAIAAGAAGGVTMGAFFLELFKIIVLALMIIIPVRYFVVQPFFVKGQSMEPNFSNGEYLLIDEISYRFKAPERGDVVVFKAPNSGNTFYIKRVIGLPGETVEVIDGIIRIENEAYPRGVELEEVYLPEGLKTPGSTSVTLGSGEFFVLGDNRGQSSDSRVWGAVPEGHIVGRAWVRGFPLANAGSIPHPEYPFLGTEVLDPS